MFQHSAARRRLISCMNRHNQALVSTLSRPKAAGGTNQAIAFVIRFQHSAARRRLRCCVRYSSIRLGFNTQPPEGG